MLKRAHGSGSISKLEGRHRPWRATAPTTTDPVTKKKTRPCLGYFKTRKEAEKALSAFVTSPYALSSSVTFAMVYEQWIAKKMRSGKSQATISSYNAAFKRCALISDKPISKLKLSDILQVFAVNGDCGKSTISNIKIVIDGVYEMAERFEYIGKNYARLVDSDDLIYTVPAEAKHRIFTLDEVHDVLTAPRDIYTDCTKILLFTGFRVDELLTMKQDNIFLSDGYFQGGMKTKAGKGRIVPIHHEITDIVAEYYGNSGKAKVFPTNQAALRDKMSERWGHIPHDTRHTFISRMQTLGADRVCLERIVGHSSTNITDKVYTHKELPELRACMELLTY